MSETGKVEGVEGSLLIDAIARARTHAGDAVNRTSVYTLYSEDSEGEGIPALPSSSSAKKIGSPEPSARWPIVAALLDDPDRASRALIASLEGWAHQAHVHRIAITGCSSTSAAAQSPAPEPLARGLAGGLGEQPRRDARQSTTLAEDQSVEPLPRTQPPRPDGLHTPVSLD